MKNILRFSFILLLSMTLRVFAQPLPEGGVTSTSSSGTPEPLKASFLIEDVENFERDREDLAQKIINLGVLDSVQTDFDEVNLKLSEHQLDFAKRSRLSSWDFRRANDFKSSLKDFFATVQKIKDDYVAFLKVSDEILSDLESRRSKFRQFALKAKSDPDLAGQAKLIQGALAHTDQLISETEKARNAYARLYQDNTASLERVRDFKKAISREIKKFRGAHFYKSSPSLFERDFYVRFGLSLEDEMRETLLSLTEGFDTWVRERIRFIWPWIASVAFLFLLFRRLGKSERWAMVFLQPLGLSLTLSVLGAGIIASQGTVVPIVVLLFWGLMGVLLSLMIYGYSMEIGLRRDVFVLITVYFLFQILETLALPLPVYRMLLLGISIFVTAYAVRRYRIAKADDGHLGKRTGFGLLGFVFFTAIIAETSGYHPLSSYLVRGMIASCFLVFAVWSLKFLLLPVVLDLMDAFFKTLRVSLLVRHTMLRKLKVVLNTLLVGIMLVKLLTVWEGQGDFFSALEDILPFGFSISGHLFTLRMVCIAVSAFYLILAIAEIVCAVLESQVYTSRQIGVGTGKSINTLIYYFAWVMGLFAAFTSLGFELQQFAIIAGALSVGIGFGLQNIVNNFVSGLILLFERPIKVGDMLDIEGQWGTVEKMGLRSTVIRSLTKTQIIIPNSDFVTRKVENLTFSDSEYRIFIKVGVAYGSDIEKVQNILMQIASEHPNIEKDPAPRVFFTDFGESSLNFELAAWTDDVSLKREIISDVNFSIEKRFRDAGIVVPFPQRVVHFANKPEMAV